MFEEAPQGVCVWGGSSGKGRGSRRKDAFAHAGGVGYCRMVANQDEVNFVGLDVASKVLKRNIPANNSKRTNNHQGCIAVETHLNQSKHIKTEYQ